MKYFKTLTFILIVTLISFCSCNDSTKAQKGNDEKALEVKDTISQTKPVEPVLKEPAQNAAGVWHYTCLIGCPGGAGVADKCKTCGNVLVHNTTYHSNTPSTNNANASPMVNPSAAPAKPEPAQNDAGVWHYTCSKGCAGGAGSAIACSTCNETLAHNAAYH